LACQSKSSGLESVDVDVDDAGGSTTAVGTMDAPRTARREPRAAVVGAARRIDLFPESATTTRASIRRVTPTRDAEADAPRRVTRTGVAVTRAMAGDESIGVFEWSRRERKCRDNWIMATCHRVDNGEFPLARKKTPSKKRQSSSLCLSYYTAGCLINSYPDSVPAWRVPSRSVL
jgi:hypothetical protein